MAAARPEDLPYRPCVGAVLLNRRGDVFVGQRIDTTMEAWQMPQGGLDPGEDPRDALLRELEEEIGTAKVEIIAETEEWLTYDLPPELIGKVWKGRFRGQRQKWYVLRFLGNDSDINLNTPHPEFNDWKWLAFEDLPEVIVPFKRGIYKELVRRFGRLIAEIRSMS